MDHLHNGTFDDQSMNSTNCTADDNGFNPQYILYNKKSFVQQSVCVMFNQFFKVTDPVDV